MFINSLSFVGTRLLNLIVLLWLQQYLLKRISTEEYSLYPVLIAAIIFLPIFVTVLTKGLGRYPVEAYARGDDDGVTHIVSTMFPLLALASVVFLALGWTFAWYVDRILTIPPDRVWDARIMMALLFVPVIVWLPLAPFSVGLEMRQRYVIVNAIDVSKQVLRLALLFTLLFGVSTRVMWVVVASVTSEATGTIVTLFVSRHMVKSLRYRPCKIDWPLARKLMSFGGWNVVAQLADAIRTTADPIVLNKLATPLDVTCFSLGAMPLRNLHAMAMQTIGSLQTPLTALHTLDEKERLAGMYLRGCRTALWTILLPAVPLMIYSHELIMIYVGAEYILAAPVMTVLLVSILFEYVNIMMGVVAMARARVGGWATRAMIVQLINLAMTFCFVGGFRWGAIGSASATLLSMALTYPLIMWPLALRNAGLGWARWFGQTVYPGLTPAVCGAVAWFILKFAVHPNSWFTLGACTAFGSLGYLAALFGFCMQADDREDFRRVVAKFASQFKAR